MSKFCGKRKSKSSKKYEAKDSRGRNSRRQDRRDRRVPRKAKLNDIVDDVRDFLTTYIVVPKRSSIVVASWIVSAWMMESWDRFPHLAVTSPEKRCGKTRFLQIVELLVPNAVNTPSISSAGIYRLIEDRRPTLLLDEAQSLTRRNTESSEAIREIFCAGIDSDSKVLRCGGEDHSVQEFSIYCPKVVALIGNLDNVLADRCIPIGMSRKSSGDAVERYRSRVVKPLGMELATRIKSWASNNEAKVRDYYDTLEPFDIENDRLAELLLPLQAVVSIASPHCLDELLSFARDIEERERQSEMSTEGVVLLTAIREIFDDTTTDTFLPSNNLIQLLKKRDEEPWSRMTAERLANLLRPYQIRSRRNRKQTHRGYYCFDFKSAWKCYLPPLS